MAVEWAALGVGIAVVKVALRLYGDPDVADMVDDTVGGVPASLLRKLLKAPKPKDLNQLGHLIAGRIEAGVPDRVREQMATDPDAEEASQVAAKVVAGLADQPAALSTALARSGDLLAWVGAHGGTRARQKRIPIGVEGVYDAVLEAAVSQLVVLAPTSQRAVSAGMAEALQQLAAVMPKLDDIHTDVRSVGEGVKELLDRPGRQKLISWPVVPRPAPARATAYQDREVTADLPQSGTVVLAGSSGFGKTQIAAAMFAASAADLKLWVPASSRDQVLSAYADAAVAVGIADAAESVEERAVRLLGWLTAPPENRSWLIALDDLTNPADLIATDTEPGWWPPVTGQGLTVTTTLSQSPVLSNEGRRLQPVDHYSRTESVNYLTRRLSDHAADLPADALGDAEKLAEDLGHHPLALGQAAAVIITDQTTIADYRIRLAAETLDQVLPETARADGYTRPLHKVFQIALDRANSQSPHAAKLLTLLGMLDPTGAPRDLLDTHAIGTYLNATGQEIRTALMVLRNLSLTSHTPQLGARAIRTHPLTGRLAREQDPTDTVGAGCAAADAMLEVWPEIEFDPTRTAALRANVRVLEDHDSTLHKRILWNLSAGTYFLVFRQNRSLGEAGLLAEAIEHGENLVATATNRFGPDHPDTLTARGNLARWRGEAGDPARARAACKELFDDFLRILGPDHPDTLTARGNLARWRGHTGNPAGAAASYRKVLEGRLRVLGPDDPDTLIARGNLAHWRGEADDPVGAAAAYKELLEDCLRVLGPDHPNTLTARGNLAHWHGYGVDPGEAASMYKELLTDFLRVCGPDHPYTLITRHSLARWCGYSGDPATAAAAFSELLDDQERVLGPDHPNTLATRAGLARWRGEAGDPAAAAAAFGELLDDQERVLGPNHPHTLITRSNLGYWRRRGGR